MGTRTGPAAASWRCVWDYAGHRIKESPARFWAAGHARAIRAWVTSPTSRGRARRSFSRSSSGRPASMPSSPRTLRVDSSIRASMPGGSRSRKVSVRLGPTSHDSTHRTGRPSGTRVGGCCRMVRSCSPLSPGRLVGSCPRDRSCQAAWISTERLGTTRSAAARSVLGSDGTAMQVMPAALTAATPVGESSSPTASMGAIPMARHAAR